MTLVMMIKWKIFSKKIEDDFSSLDNFNNEFDSRIGGIFGSGWGWLAYDKHAKKLVIRSTSNAETLIGNELLVPLLVCDVWEHAYYVDYENRRTDYIKNFKNV